MDQIDQFSKTISELSNTANKINQALTTNSFSVISFESLSSQMMLRNIISGTSVIFTAKLNVYGDWTSKLDNA